MNSAALSLMLRGGHLAQLGGKAKFLPALQVVYTVHNHVTMFLYTRWRGSVLKRNIFGSSRALQ